MCRGRYLAYIYRTWKEESCAPVMLDGDEQCLQANTADYIAFSYYRSAVYKKEAGNARSNYWRSKWFR